MTICPLCLSATTTDELDRNDGEMCDLCLIAESDDWYPDDAFTEEDLGDDEL